MNADLLPAIIAAGGAVLGAVAGGSATYYIQKLIIKNNENDERIRIYGQLLGNKKLVSQSYASHYSACMQIIYAESHCTLEALQYHRKGDDSNEIQQKQKDSWSCQEAKRNRQRYEDTQFLLASNIGLMWETIGQLNISFNTTNEIVEHINRIRQTEKILDNFQDDLYKDQREKFNIIDESRRFSLPEERFNSWSQKKHQELEEWFSLRREGLIKLIEEFENSIDELLEVIEDKMLKK